MQFLHADITEPKCTVYPRISFCSPYCIHELKRKKSCIPHTLKMVLCNFYKVCMFSESVGGDVIMRQDYKADV